MKALVAHPGTQYSLRLAEELFRNGALASLYTGIAFPAGSASDRLVSILPRRWKRRMANRRLSALPSDMVHTDPWDEAVALLRQRFGGTPQSVFHRRNAAFQRRISTQALQSADAVIGFDTSGWILAERCRDLNRSFFLDQSIGHPDAKAKALAPLRARYAEWFEETDSRRPEVRQAEAVEHDLASVIVVASSFSARTLIDHGIDRRKIVVNPYGVDCERFSVGSGDRAPGRGRKLRLIYAGALSLRKGVPQLLEVWKRLRPEHAELWLVGPATSRVVSLVRTVPNVTYKGAVPQTEVAALMRQCDVFVFPSLFEGFALVILEAMACGLPVITTTATAGPDVLTDGRDGWVIAPGDDEQLASAITRCLANPTLVADAGSAARRTAEQFTWERYGRRWLDLLNGRIVPYLAPVDAVRTPA